MDTAPNSDGFSGIAPPSATKLGTVEEEADETLFWLELAVDSNLVSVDRARPLLREADQLTAIFVASVKTAKR